jgi:hypothetical protein
MYSTVNRIFFHFSYFEPDYLTSGLTVTGLVRVYCSCNYLMLLFAELWRQPLMLRCLLPTNCRMKRWSLRISAPGRRMGKTVNKVRSFTPSSLCQILLG